MYYVVLHLSILLYYFYVNCVFYSIGLSSDEGSSGFGAGFDCLVSSFGVSLLGVSPAAPVVPVSPVVPFVDPEFSVSPDAGSTVSPPLWFPPSFPELAFSSLSFGIFSVSFTLQFLQVLTFSPSSSTVGPFSIIQSPNLCPVASKIFVFVSPQLHLNVLFPVFCTCWIFVFSYFCVIIMCMFWFCYCSICKVCYIHIYSS